MNSVTGNTAFHLPVAWCALILANHPGARTEPFAAAQPWRLAWPLVALCWTGFASDYVCWAGGLSFACLPSCEI